MKKLWSKLENQWSAFCDRWLSFSYNHDWATGLIISGNLILFGGGGLMLLLAYASHLLSLDSLKDVFIWLAFGCGAVFLVSFLVLFLSMLALMFVIVVTVIFAIGHRVLNFVDRIVSRERK